ncbi:MAG: peptidoglycan bridge formation glycyltransferase FemA/FemB family protein [Patescibacteria group bacterium]
MFKSILQTDFWAKFKEDGGWQSKKYGNLYGLTRQLPFGRSILYFPEIPLDLEHGIPFDDQAIYISRKDDEKPPKGRIFTRFEFLEFWTPEHANKLLHAGLVKAFEDVQPEYRQWVMLDKSEEELLKDMKPKGRYNIGVAKKHGLEIKWGITDQSIQILFGLYGQTAKRADFQGRDLPYFQRLAKTLEENKAGEIVVVSKDGEPLSALLLSFYGGVCSYLYGGSGGDRSLMAPYLAHWEAIKRAKQDGCAIYDLLAIAPMEQLATGSLATSQFQPEASSQKLVANLSSHPHSGLTRFKTQFGGQSVRLLGSWDLVHSPIWYRLYRLAEKHRRKTVK